MKVDFDQVAEGFEICPWRMAMTMPENPHQYTLKKEWSDEPAFFESVVQFIRECGYDEPFAGKNYTLLDVNEHKYWTMGAPLYDTILINRKVRNGVNFYDQLAPAYDELWDNQKAMAENQMVMNLIGYEGGDVLDIGCGTGLFLDRHRILGAYTGLDPSIQMLLQLRLKHPLAPIENASFERYFTRQRFDMVVSLFGAASYVSPVGWKRLRGMLQTKGRFFLMFYKDGYTPITHEHLRKTPVIYNHEHALLSLGDNVSTSFIGNFVILKGGKK